MMNITIPVGSFLCSLHVAATPARAAEVPENAYLFSDFLNSGEDGLRLAWSADGLKWQGALLKPKGGFALTLEFP